MNNLSTEKLEAVLRKINWAQDILNSAQESTGDNPQIANILSGIAFIIDSASADAEDLYRLVQ